ncbi:hypothetical protein ATO6_02855 [Oceanicola sp. 22II-s10i]|nr:hypothetical protein ATO6_02855 [Oceanicola sp. 22II-s10i]
MVEKLSRWAVSAALPDALKVPVSEIGYLATLKFVVGKRIATLASCEAKSALANFLAMGSELEATDEEIELAAEIEAAAIDSELDLDAGESILIAVSLKRDVKKLATGDKRAVCSCQPLSQTLNLIEPLRGRIITLEQILAQLIRQLDFGELRGKVCGDPCDKTAGICFGCSSEGSSETSALDALLSYQKHLAKESSEFTAPNLAS